MKPPRPGAFVKVTLAEEMGDVYADVSTPFWAVVEDYGPGNGVYVTVIGGGTKLFEAVCDEQGINNWWVGPEDTFEVIDKADVPDKIWAAFGERSLASVDRSET